MLAAVIALEPEHKPSISIVGNSNAPLPIPNKKADVDFLFNLVLKVLSCNQIRDVIVIIVAFLLVALRLLHGLVALSQLSKRGEGVGAELVEDAGDEFSELFVFASSVDGKGVGWDCGMDYRLK
jgi:hypothetical protein